MIGSFGYFNICQHWFGNGLLPGGIKLLFHEKSDNFKIQVMIDINGNLQLLHLDLGFDI